MPRYCEARRNFRGFWALILTSSKGGTMESRNKSLNLCTKFLRIYSEFEMFLRGSQEVLLLRLILRHGDDLSHALDTRELSMVYCALTLYHFLTLQNQAIVIGNLKLTRWKYGVVYENFINQTSLKFYKTVPTTPPISLNTVSP